MHGVSNARFANRGTRPPVFMDSHQTKRSASLALKNLAGNDYVEVPSGTVIAKCGDSLHRPCAADALTSAAAGVTTLAVSDAYQFRVGDWVFVEATTLPTQITDIDYDNNTLTVADAITAALGETVEVDPSITVAPANGAEGGGANVINVDTAAIAALFRVGSTITIDGVAGARTITDITGTAITFDGAAATWADNALIVQGALGGYKIMVSTVISDYGHGMAPNNTNAPYRTHGEARKEAVLGLVAAAEAALTPLVEFKSLHA